MKNWLIVRGWWPCCWRWFYDRYHGDEPEIDYDGVRRDREDGGYVDGLNAVPLSPDGVARKMRAER